MEGGSTCKGLGTGSQHHDGAMDMNMPKDLKADNHIFCYLLNI